MAVEVAFWALAVVTVGGALGVVVLRDVFRAALLLVIAFFAIAGIYVTLQADFLAAVQVLIYVGAISVLLIFAIMLTRGPQRLNPSSRLRRSAFVLAGLVLAVLIYAFVKTPWPLSPMPPVEPTTGPIGDVLFNRFLLPFEAASVLLLAAIIGAIALVRDK